jgi:hypothetical protein
MTKAAWPLGVKLGLIGDKMDLGFIFCQGKWIFGVKEIEERCTKQEKKRG